MRNFATQYLASTFLVCFFSINGQAQTAMQSQNAVRPLRASEVLALIAGGALPSNIVHDIATRGLNFRTDATFLTQVTQAGGNAAITSALKEVKPTEKGVAPDTQALEGLTNAAILIQQKHYNEAVAELQKAVQSSFVKTEAGFIMAEVLLQNGDAGQAAAIYMELMREDPDFPELHTKLSYVLYRTGDPEQALGQAKLALALNHDDAEAHKNAGLALGELRKFDAAVVEYKAALRVKPDYDAVHYDLGLLYNNQRAYEDSIAEYKKAIAINPNASDYHNNLGHTYHEMGNLPEAVREFKEAKRLQPNDPMIRQNLGSALMSQNPREAVVELRELEKMFPDFEMCHICLGKGLAWTGDTAAAEAEYRLAAKLDPSDSEPHTGLGNIQEQQEKYDAALEQYKIAERLSPDTGKTHEDVGRVLLIKKDSGAAVSELSQAQQLAPSSPSIHELYAQALQASGQTDAAIAEYREAIALDPKQSHYIVELGSALEKKGDWAGAMEQYQKASLTQANTKMKVQAGDVIRETNPDPEQEYKRAQLRFADHLTALRAAGKSGEAAELEGRVQVSNTSAGTLRRVQTAMKAGQDAWSRQQYDVSEKFYSQAVSLAEHLPPGDENLIISLQGLGNAYAMRQDYKDAESAYRRELSIVEKTFGPMSPRATDPLLPLAHLAALRKDSVAAENYLLRSVDIDVKNFGEQDAHTTNSLRQLAGFYTEQKQWSKAETYTLRAVKASEGNDPVLLITVWGLCDLYDRWGKVDQAQLCWHRETGLMEKQVGENGPDLAQPLNNEAQDLRKLGRAAEAAKLEQRVAKLGNN